MQSAVQSRIASFEAASRRGMSPSRPIPDIRNYRHRPTNAIGPINELDSKEQKQQQAKAELDVSIPRSRQKHRTLNYESISLEVKGTSSFDRNEIDTKTCGTILRIRTGSDESYGEDYQKKGCSKSTPVDQSSREDSSYFLSPSSTTMTASENRKSRIRRSIRENNNSTPTTNLSEKRRQRLLLQSRRRTKNDVPDLNSEGCGDETANLGSIVGDRWSKLSRLQGRPNTINRRQFPTTTNVKRESGSSVEMLFTRNDATNVDMAKYGSQGGFSPESFTTKPRDPKKGIVGSQFSDYCGGVDQQQLNASLEAPTDDDVTLTSVHRIMEKSNFTRERISIENNHNQPHIYEILQGQQSASLLGIYNGKCDNYNSNDRNVGPSGKLNRGASNRTAVWKEDEKSERVGYGATGSCILRTEYSSDYDMDDGSKSDRSSRSTYIAEGMTKSQTMEDNDYFTNSRYHNNINSLLQGNVNSKRIDDDDRTFDYGDRDDESNSGTSFAMRRREAEQRHVRLATSLNTDDLIKASSNVNIDQGIHEACKISAKNGKKMLLSQDEVEHFLLKDSSTLRLSAGVAVVSTLGLCMGGPVGLLAGVAVGGLGFGFMQIPEEEREKIQIKAVKAVNNLQEKACDASEKVSSSCINTYQDSGVADHVPHCLSSNVTDQLVKNCPTGMTAKSENFGNASGTAGNSAQMNFTGTDGVHNFEKSSSPLMEQNASFSLSQNEHMRNKKVTCLRNVRILPIAQIHRLEPSSQPRAWLDVVASANTSNEQKNEAMEEILLLAKDKRRAKIFLDEGILDYILWTLSRYMEKVEVIGKTTEWAFPVITSSEKTAANLAAMCCVTLGKAHCAAIHTEGDLLLMSMYERGTVPEERQVAQMLHEVPHYARVTKTNDPTIVEPSKEVFASRQLSLFQAEELAEIIKLVADNQI